MGPVFPFPRDHDRQRANHQPLATFDRGAKRAMQPRAVGAVFVHAHWGRRNWLICGDQSH